MPATCTVIDVVGNTMKIVTAHEQDRLIGFKMLSVDSSYAIASMLDMACIHVESLLAHWPHDAWQHSVYVIRNIGFTAPAVDGAFASRPALAGLQPQGITFTTPLGNLSEERYREMCQGSLVAVDTPMPDASQDLVALACHLVMPARPDVD